MNFFKLYIGDYQRDTAHLSLTEHGAYQLMLQHYYATEKPLPTGKALYRMLRADGPADREAIDTVAGQFWTETDAGLVNGRANDELTKASSQADTNRRIAVEREAKRKDHAPSTNRATDRGTNRPTSAQPIQTPDSRHQNQEPEPEPDTRAESDARDASERQELQAGPDGWTWYTTSIKPVYPTEIYPATDDVTASHYCDAIVSDGLASREQLEQNVAAFRAQQQAAGNLGTKFVMRASRFFDPVRGSWRGPFKIPDEPQKPQREKHRYRTADEIEAEERSRAAN